MKNNPKKNQIWENKSTKEKVIIQNNDYNQICFSKYKSYFEFIPLKAFKKSYEYTGYDF